MSYKKRNPNWGDYKRFKSQYDEARREHAFLLRCEGLTYKEIAKRIGSTSEFYVKDWIKEFGARLSRSIFKTRFYYEHNPERMMRW